ncbi:hypothetical protein D3C77_270190 [compost metagenome]
MSGAQTLQNLDRLVGTTNELFLSEDPKMVDVGGGVMRPTNAKILADLAIQMAGALIYTSVALGLAGTSPGGYFSVQSANDRRYVELYRNDAGSATYIDDYPNATATQRAEGLAETAYDLVYPRSLDEEMPWAIVDRYFRAILGVKANGAVHALLDRMPGLDLLGEYAWAIADANGVVLLGIKWSGEVVMFGQGASTVQAYADGPIGGQDIWVLVNGVPYQVTSSGDNFSPVVVSGKVNYIGRYGPVIQQSVDMPAPGSVATFVNRLLHIISSGQSLAMGSSSPLITTQQPAANRLFTLQDGVRLTNQDGTLTPAMVAPFIPLVGKTLETPVVQLSSQLNRLRGVPSDAGLLTSCHGRGGNSIAQLSKGTLYYTNAMTAVTAAKAHCDTLGLGYAVPFFDWIQGEADRNAAAGVYTTALLQLQSDFESDVKAVSGQPGKLPMLLDQISNFTAYGITQSNVPLEQLQVALDYPDRFVCAGPKYWVPTVEDGVHLQSMSSVRIGSMHARAGEAIINGQLWKPTHAVSAVRSGSVITLEFYTPSGPLVVDTSSVTDPGNWGLRYVDDTSSASIQSVRLAGRGTVEITLSAVPTGANPRIGIADIGTANAAGGPTTGPRSCLRDSSPDLDAYGQPVFNWACHQRISVQAA